MKYKQFSCPYKGGRNIIGLRRNAYSAPSGNRQETWQSPSEKSNPFSLRMRNATNQAIKEAY
jgi:hypothetical protein